MKCQCFFIEINILFFEMPSSTKLDADTFEKWKEKRSLTRALCDLLVLMKDSGIEIKTMMKSVYDVCT